jgi:MSHA biogenesis protein MshK
LPPNVSVPGGDAGAVAQGPRLESVLIGPDRRIAVISGQQYRMGDKFGEGRIVRINESEVAIRSGESVEVLKLIPGVEKRLRPRRTKGTR